MHVLLHGRRGVSKSDEVKEENFFLHFRENARTPTAFHYIHDNLFSRHSARYGMLLQAE